VNYPEKIGDFENWDESKEFKAGMKVCAASFSFLETAEDIEKMLSYQKATEIAIINGENDEIKAFFENEGSEKREDLINFFAFIAKKSTNENSTNNFGFFSEVDIDDDAFFKNITKEYFGEALAFLDSTDVSEAGGSNYDESSDNNEENFTNMEGNDNSSDIENADSSIEINNSNNEASSISSIKKGCQLPFIPIDEIHCGHVLPPDTQENIQRTCSTFMNSTLPNPTSFEENYSFSIFMPQNNQTGYNDLFWLGIKYDTMLDNWRTAYKENVDFTLWANDGTDNCAIVVRTEPFTMILIIFKNANSIPLWSTKNCSDLIAGLCILPRLNDETPNKSENIKTAIGSPTINLAINNEINLEINFNSRTCSACTNFCFVFILSLLF